MGVHEGLGVGRTDGIGDGNEEGIRVGRTDGIGDGTSVGIPVGLTVGTLVGDDDVEGAGVGSARVYNE